MPVLHIAHLNQSQKRRGKQNDNKNALAISQIRATQLQENKRNRTRIHYFTHSNNAPTRYRLFIVYPIVPPGPISEGKRTNRSMSLDQTLFPHRRCGRGCGYARLLSAMDPTWLCCEIAIPTKCASNGHTHN